MPCVRRHVEDLKLEKGADRAEQREPHSRKAAPRCRTSQSNVQDQLAVCVQGGSLSGPLDDNEPEGMENRPASSKELRLIVRGAMICAIDPLRIWCGIARIDAKKVKSICGLRDTGQTPACPLARARAV